jgi:hypothetical protein
VLAIIHKLFCIVWLFEASLASAQELPGPVLFFSDITSGPATGNSDPTYSPNGGAYVTLYGNFLGTSPAVTLNGASCLTTVSKPTTWMWFQRMVVQLSRSCTTGNFVVTTSGGTSNGLTFTVNAKGHIYFVSPSGSDGSHGSFSSPWATLLRARGAMADGDITYAENGTAATVDDREGWGAAYTIRPQWCSASPSTLPRSLVAYPGAKVTVGNRSSLFAMRSTEGSCKGGLTFAELTLIGLNDAVLVGGTGSSYWRYVGNDMSCPAGKGATACFVLDTSTYTYFLGNNMHDVGNSNDNLYHGVYIGGGDILWEIGWSTISNVQGCRGIQVYAGNGAPFSNFSIHDSLIHDTTCDGIGMYSVSPSAGSVSIYNNVIFNAGEGPPNSNGGGWTCIMHKESGRESGTIEIFNNTLYSCGNVVDPPYAGSNYPVINYGGTGVLFHMRNNVFYQTSPATWPFWGSYGASAKGIFGTNNLVYGTGVLPVSSSVTGTINANPNFIDASTLGCPRQCRTDLHVAAPNSPTNGAGAAISVIPFGANWTGHDRDGLLRRSPPSIGAYEYAAHPVASKAN